MRSAAMDVAAGKRKPPADGKPGRCPGRAAQNDFGGENVSGKARQSGNLYPQEFADGVADFEMMGCDMDRYVFHGLEKTATISC